MLDAFLSEAWEYHDTESDRLALELESLELLDATPDQLAQLLKLSNHTMGEHLKDWSRARLFAERVLKMPACVYGSRPWLHLAVAQYAEGDSEAALISEANYLQGQDDFVSRYIELRILLATALIGSAQMSTGAAVYRATLKLAEAAKDIELPHRAIAIASNNIAGLILEETDLTEIMIELLQESAMHALVHWRQCGNWINEERALYLVQLVHNKLAAFDQAIDYGQQALAVIEANGGEDVDEAFILLAMAHTCRHLNKQEDAESQLSKANQLAAAWGDESLQDWFSEEKSKLGLS